MPLHPEEMIVPPTEVVLTTTGWKLVVSISLFSLLVACTTFLAVNVSNISPSLGVVEIVVVVDVDIVEETMDWII